MRTGPRTVFPWFSTLPRTKKTGFPVDVSYRPLRMRVGTRSEAAANESQAGTMPSEIDGMRSTARTRAAITIPVRALATRSRRGEVGASSGALRTAIGVGAFGRSIRRGVFVIVGPVSGIAAAVAAASAIPGAVRLRSAKGSGSSTFFGGGGSGVGSGSGTGSGGSGSGVFAGAGADGKDDVGNPVTKGVESRPRTMESLVCGAGRGPRGGADSPVNSDMPNRSSASRRFAPELCSWEETPPGRFGTILADVLVLVGRPPAFAGSAVRFFSLAGAFASADLRTANTVLHALHRTRTPRSDTFSSATRKRD